MSNFIPMLSSSPPPLDDVTNVDNEEDEEFGGFSSAAPRPADFGDVVGLKAVNQNDKNATNNLTKESESSSCGNEFRAEVEGYDKTPDRDFDNKITVDNTNGSWGNFGGFDNDECVDNDPLNCRNVIGNDKTCSVDSDINGTESTLPESDQVKRGSLCQHDRDNESFDSAFPNVPDEKNQTVGVQDNTSQSSVTDSGLCSDVSPVPKTDDFCDFVESKQHCTCVDETHCSGHAGSDSSIAQSPPEPVSCPNSQITAAHDPSESAIANSSSTNRDTETDLESPSNNFGENMMQKGNDSDPEPLDLKPVSFVEEDEVAEDAEDDYGQFVSPSAASADTPGKEDKMSLHSSSSSSGGFGQAGSCPTETCPNNENCVCVHDQAVLSNADIASTSDVQSSALGAEGCVQNVPDPGNLHSGADPNSAHSKSSKSYDIEFTGDLRTVGGDDNFAQSVGPDEDDEFSDFKAVDDNWAAFGDQTVEGDDGDDNWADFHIKPAPPSAAQQEEPGGFRDFTKCESQPLSMKVDYPKKLSDLLLESFPLADADTSLAVDLLLECLGKQVLRTEEHISTTAHQIGGGKQQAYRKTIDVSVWNNLRDIERTNSVKYQWNKSSNSNRLLKSLTIDKRNILIGHKKQSLPIFASQLGMLEPSRGASEQSSPSADIVDHMIVDTSKPPSTHPSPQDIPPAEFDWNSSGLTNPLDSSSNLQLDLDFFIKNAMPSSYSHASNSEVLQKEKEILQAIEPHSRDPPKTLQPLENILATMRFTPTAPVAVTKKKSDSGLSEKGRKILSRMPDLSFMRAKVLMFPVRGDVE